MEHADPNMLATGIRDRHSVHCMSNLSKPREIHDYGYFKGDYSMGKHRGRERRY